MEHVTAGLSFISSCIENETKGRPQWKKGAPFLQGLQNIGVSGAGVLFGVGFALRKKRTPEALSKSWTPLFKQNLNVSYANKRGLAIFLRWVFLRKK